MKNSTLYKNIKHIICAFLSVIVPTFTNAAFCSKYHFGLETTDYSFPIRSTGAVITINKSTLTNSAILTTATTLEPYFNRLEKNSNSKHIKLFVTINRANYECIRVHHHYGFSFDFKPQGHNYALLILDRVIPNIQPVSINTRSGRNPLPKNRSQTIENVSHISNFQATASKKRTLTEISGIFFLNLDIPCNTCSSCGTSLERYSTWESTLITPSPRASCIFFNKIKNFFSRQKLTTPTLHIPLNTPLFTTNEHSTTVELLGFTVPRSDESEDDQIQVDNIKTDSILHWVETQTLPYCDNPRWINHITTAENSSDTLQPNDDEERMNEYLFFFAEVAKAFATHYV